MTPERRSFVAEIKALKNGDIEAYISTESVDRVGDILTARGWELDNFRKGGGPVLFGHEYGITAGGQIPLIGNAVQIEIQGKGLWSVTRFHEKTQLSRDAAVLAREKILPSWSVGFNPLEPPTSRMVDGVFKGHVYTRQELLEYSLIPVPANAEAISKAQHLMQKGLVSRSFTLAAPAEDCDDELAQVVRDFTKRAKTFYSEPAMTRVRRAFGGSR